VIYVEPSVGLAIALFKQGAQKERPLTHHLLAKIFRALETSPDRSAIGPSCENEHDIVLVHDPQPLPFIEFFSKKCPWVWRCHVDLSEPHGTTWEYLIRFIQEYDAVILSCKAYKQKLRVPQLVFMPAIDPSFAL
jgi:hypothetical protein